MRRFNSKKKKKTERVKSRVYDERYLGPEPEFVNIDPLKRQMVKANALNWYNYFWSTKDLIDDICAYAKKVLDLDKYEEFLKKLNDRSFSFTAGKLIRMHTRGWALDRRECEFIQRELDRVIASEYKNSPSEEELSPEELDNSEGDKERKIEIVQPPQTTRSFSQILYELDAIEDCWILKDDFPEKYSIYERQQVLREPRKNLFLVQEWIESRFQEFTAYIEDYEGQNLRQRVSFLESARNEIQRLLSDRRKQRQPRKKKSKSADKLVAKCKWQKTSAEYKINSENPERLIGACETYFFNTKTRRLEHYVSLSGGFSIKGTTLQNWDEEKSTRTTLRKPEEVLTFILSNTSKKINEHLHQNLSTKFYADLSGRLNEDTIIIRVFSGKSS